MKHPIKSWIRILTPILLIALLMGCAQTVPPSPILEPANPILEPLPAEPPVITPAMVEPSLLTHFETPVTSDMLLNLVFEVQPSAIIQSYLDPNTGDWYHHTLEDSTLILPSNNGYYEVYLECHYNTLVNVGTKGIYEGVVTHSFALEVLNPLTAYFASTQSQHITLFPGDVAMIAMNHAPLNASLAVDNPFGDKHNYFSHNGQDYLIVPIAPTVEPGDYSIHIGPFEDQIDPVTLTLTLEDKFFPVQNLYVNETTSALSTNDNLMKDQVYFDAAWLSEIPTPLWEGPFIIPSEGRVTSEYGLIRVTNDDWSRTRRHLGIDFAAPIGTPIYAANTGKVVLSHELIVFGNTVVIDHGMGFYSLYFHLDTLESSLGDDVKKGQQIGTMGTTGYSTGSHLHFGMRFNGVYLNPWPFFESEYLPF